MANDTGMTDGGDLESNMKIFFSSYEQPFSMSFYVGRLVTYCNCSSSAFVLALAYLDRVQVASRRMCLTQQNCHRLLSTALLLAIKFLDDEVCTNAYYCTVFGIGLSDLNQLELAMLKLLDWNLFINPTSYMRYECPLYQAAEFLGSSSSE